MDKQADLNLHRLARQILLWYNQCGRIKYKVKNHFHVLFTWGQLRELLTLDLRNQDRHRLWNSVDRNLMASEEAISSGSTLFVVQFLNLYEHTTSSIWVVDSQKWDFTVYAKIGVKWDGTHGGHGIQWPRSETVDHLVFLCSGFKPHARHTVVRKLWDIHSILWPGWTEKKSNNSVSFIQIATTVCFCLTQFSDISLAWQNLINEDVKN